MKQKSQELIGKTVISDGGVVIGEVKDYFVDTTSWNITDIQVKIEKKKAKELGLKTPFFSSLLVLVEVHKIQSFNDQVVLGLSADDFKPYIEARQTDDDVAEEEGDAVERTVDLHTCAGYAHLIHLVRA